MKKDCKQTKCQYYHNGRGCLNCIHNPDTHVYKLQKQIDQLQADNERLKKAIKKLFRRIEQLIKDKHRLTEEVKKWENMTAEELGEMIAGM